MEDMKKESKITPGEGLEAEIKRNTTKSVYKTMTWDEIKQRGKEIFKAQDKDRNERRK